MDNPIRIVKVPKASDNLDLSAVEGLYRELYEGDENQQFYRSRLDLNAFRSGQILLAAKSGNKIIGYCWVVWYEHIKKKGVGYLEELYVEESARKHNIGKKLINETIRLLKKHGIRTIYSAVGRHMKKSQAFYKHIGFMKSNEAWVEKEL